MIPRKSDSRDRMILSAAALLREYDVIRKIVAAHADSLDEVTEPRFAEWDLWPGNCMVRDGRIVAVRGPA
ncbi:hypothetical protein AB0N81_31140 [Streptomyces sp. NPDC093510]|uniref:hypothetical protein n=1 Tax=Streptomyces sp. NPDC093510 TaxID=3155199 RepID=UPI00343B1545